MIISHEKKLIFFKTKKVGGTSFEIALSAFCGPDDIITRITPEDEKTRQGLGFRGAQNFDSPYGVFGNHTRADRAKELLPTEIWDSYHKVSITRSPYDVMVSFYYWQGNPRRVSYLDFVKENSALLLDAQAITHIGGVNVMDRMIRYDHLEEDIIAMEAEQGLEGLYDIFAGLRAKGNTRPKQGASAAEMHAKYPEAKAIIDSVCRDEIAKYGYSL